MGRAADGSARAPGVPGPRGTEARGASTGGPGTPPSTRHRPVRAALDGAGGPAAAPSNRGDSPRAAAGAPASPLAHSAPKQRRSADAAPTGAALVLDSQRSVTRPAKRCPNRRIGIRLKNGTKLAPVSCKRRDCPVCGPRKARELARVLILDAQVDCPTHGMTLTTQDPDISPATFRNGVAAVFKRLRRRYGRSVEYFGMVEFTSGQGTHSGGRRRIHQHILLKGLPAHADVLDVGRDVRETWQASTGATRVEVAELRTPGGALGYLALHHKKPKQAPPADWHGMVERHSLRYFHRPIAQLREQARRELQIEAISWSTGLPTAIAALELAAGEWKRRSVEEHPDRSVIAPLLETEGAPPPTESDWIMRRGQFVHRQTGELFSSPGRASFTPEGGTGIEKRRREPSRIAACLRTQPPSSNVRKSE